MRDSEAGADQHGEIYCGNVRQPSPLLYSGHRLPARSAPSSGPRSALEGALWARRWAQRGLGAPQGPGNARWARGRV